MAPTRARLSSYPVLLRGEGCQVNPKRVYRLYREMGLQLRNRSCARTGNQPHDRTRPGRWTSFMISLPLGASYGCLRSLTRSRASRRRSNLGSTSAALMLWRYSKRSAGKSDSRKQSGSIKAQSFTRSRPLGISARRHARLLPTGASPLTTLSSTRSTANSERNV
jgi:hypothetical protein